ncbi:uncharacterized protein Z518_04522 [Rhinocladiella mackenziei CBS 650.93]|uniref:Uncharacterized protein n=1 Tax=Rhinocladiella mackenziei CBS 650.93 TaxID=1442369 RepID=A0A0D2ITR9_9EURO|nr:uncharacterized protein Z518_04522 [Rhinocladiella mackenziei CBS 650.93]KIX06546.1 hypothetical protein Z518_04522 [Rhinocladiella mackenziei CBS 650.93]
MACTAQNRYMFVEYSAPAPPVKGQKKRRGGPSEVRAHITKEFHRRLRVKRLDALKGTVPLPERPKVANPTIEQEDEEQDWKHSGTRSPSIHTRPASPNKNIPPELYLSRRLRTVLGEGRMDPFDVLPAHRMPLFIHMVLDHALAHSWPNTVPTRSPAVMNPVKSAWLKCAMEWPVAFHAFIYATTLHLLCAYNGRELIDSAPVLRLSHKVETIKLVNEQLHNLNGLPSDALIMAVTILAIHGTRDATAYPQIHPASPMAEAQNLHVYGNMVNEEEHVPAILWLIMQKGGLDGIELYGMADTMALCDLYFASKYAYRPTFPLRRPHQSLVVTGKHLLDAPAIELDSKLGRGFRYFRSTPAGRELLDVLESFCEVTTALDHYYRGGPTAPELIDLIEARNSSQHRLLSQIPAELDLSDLEMCLHQAIRLAALIFSDMVLFPLPEAQQVKQRLAPMLRQTLEACRFLQSWELNAQVLVWALVLGGIATSFSNGQVWFIDQLLQQLSALQVLEWSTLESICSKFLWWKPVCSEPGQRLWKEMFPPTHDT